MKRIITFLFGFALLCCVGFAKDFSNGISSGGFWVLDGNLGEGYGEWSFPIVKNKKNFMIKDSVTIGGFGGSSSGKVLDVYGLSVGNKLNCGCIYDDTGLFAIKVYGILGGDVSLIKTENHKFFSPSAIFGTIVGGGFEFQYTERSSFVAEFGGKYRYEIGENVALYKVVNNMGPVLMLGFRSYIN